MEIRGMGNAEVVERWREDICKRAIKDTKDYESPDLPDWDNYIWEGVWMGFVIGLGRPDLATHAAYSDLGFPEEIGGSEDVI